MKQHRTRPQNNIYKFMRQRIQQNRQRVILWRYMKREPQKVNLERSH